MRCIHTPAPPIHLGLRPSQGLRCHPKLPLLPKPVMRLQSELRLQRQGSSFPVLSCLLPLLSQLSSLISSYLYPPYIRYLTISILIIAHFRYFCNTLCLFYIPYLSILLVCFSNKIDKNRDGSF